MADTEMLDETMLQNPNGELEPVKPGDFVALLPDGLPWLGDPGFVGRFLGGEGPFKIHGIVKYPCGGVRFWLETELGKPEVHPEKFMTFVEA